MVNVNKVTNPSTPGVTRGCTVQKKKKTRSPTLKLEGRRRRFRRRSSRSRLCLRLVPAWLAIDCLCSSQSPTGLLKSSGKGVLKNQAGRPQWNSLWGVKPVEELL